MAECIFCQVVAGKIPSYKIYEDSDYLAFLDIFPKTEGHTLVIPKTHIEWVWDYQPLGEYLETVAKVARHLRQVSGEPVRSLIYGFDVPHAHVHLFPGKTDNLNGEKRVEEKMKEIQEKYKL